MCKVKNHLSGVYLHEMHHNNTSRVYKSVRTKIRQQWHINKTSLYNNLYFLFSRYLLNVWETNIKYKRLPSNVSLGGTPGLSQIKQIFQHKTKKSSTHSHPIHVCLDACVEVSMLCKCKKTLFNLVVNKIFTGIKMCLWLWNFNLELELNNYFSYLNAAKFIYAFLRRSLNILLLRNVIGHSKWTNCSWKPMSTTIPPEKHRFSSDHRS